MKTGMHYGDMGDIIYCIPTCRALGITKLYISIENECHTKMTAYNIRFMAPLFAHMGIEMVLWNHKDDYDYDLNAYRKLMEDLTYTHLGLSQARAMGVDVDMSARYIDVEEKRKGLKPYIIVNRTLRYNNASFNWQMLLNSHENIYFVGTEEEYSYLRTITGADISYLYVDDMLELARYIKGAYAFIGNQSSPFAVAEGLKVNRIQETCEWVPNALPMSKNGFPVITKMQNRKAMMMLERWRVNEPRRSETTYFVEIASSKEED